MDLDQNTGSKIYLLRLSAVAALGGLLFGYDTAVISGAIGFLKTHFQLDPTMEGWAASSALLGCALGVVFGGEVNVTLGRRKARVLSALLFLISALGTAFPRTFVQFVFFRIIGGLGVGIASMTSPLYIAEISPARMRGRMVSINQFAIILGMLVVYFVNYFIAGAGDEAWNVEQGWRYMFGSEAIPAILLLVLLIGIPESPRFLLTKGQEVNAQRVLERVDGRLHAEKEMGEIRQALQEESGALSELFGSGLRGVLVIGVLIAVLQQVTGINVFLYYAPEILKSIAGAETDVALLQTVLVGAVNLAFTILAIWVVDRLGRKPLMIVGAAGMGICLTAIGVASICELIGPWLLVFMLGYIACFAVSVGPVTWVILSEIFPTRIRGRAMAIAAFCLWVANLIVSQTFPMMDKNQTLVEMFHHGFPFLIYALFCAVLVGVVAFLVPETKGRSLEEIERMWNKDGEELPNE
jgi:SP family xylose:H+ symportor-like MFS transporter